MNNVFSILGQCVVGIILYVIITFFIAIGSVSFMKDEELFYPIAYIAGGLMFIILFLLYMNNVPIPV